MTTRALTEPVKQFEIQSKIFNVIGRPRTRWTNEQDELELDGSDLIETVEGQIRTALACTNLLFPWFR